MTSVRTPDAHPGSTSGQVPEDRRSVSDGTHPETEVLFKEAKRRDRQRRIIVATVVLVAFGSLVAATAHARRPPAAPRGLSPSAGERQPGGIRGGSIVPLEVAGPLAVSPRGVLYVADEGRDQILERLPHGQFRVVAGDGQHGFTGDGGPATQAELAGVSDLTVAEDGSLYFSDGGRVRVVNATGIIRTIAGDGGTGELVASGTDARRASLGSQISLAFSPAGELYLGTSSQLLRLTTDGTLLTVPAVVPSGPLKGNLASFDQIVVDPQGDVDVATTYAGWSIFEIAPDGVAAEVLGNARRNGGSTSILGREPNGIVVGEDGTQLMEVEGGRLVPLYTFGHVPGTKWFTLTYFAFAPNGTVYADDIGGGGFQPSQQLVSVIDGHVAVLWHHQIES